MDRVLLRHNLSFLLLVLFIWSLLSVILVMDSIDDVSTGRDRDAKTANDDSLFIFWEEGSIVGITTDLRFLVIITGVLFFVSIFSNLTIFHYSRGEENEQ